MSCLDPLPSGSCQKRRALFADGPSMVPVKKKKVKATSFIKKRLLEITLLSEKSHEAKMK